MRTTVLALALLCAPALALAHGASYPSKPIHLVVGFPAAGATDVAARALAVSTRERSKAAPEIPSLSEAGVPGYDATSWFGLLVPTGTPQEIINRLSSETAEALKDAKVRDTLLSVGSDPVGSGPQAFGEFFRFEVEKWAKVVREAKIRVE